MQCKMITAKVTPFVRLHLLKTSLDKNVFYNTDYEDTVFTSEVPTFTCLYIISHNTSLL